MGLSCLLICSLNQSRTNCHVGVGNLRLSLLVLFLIISTLQLTLKDFILQIAQLNGLGFFFFSFSTEHKREVQPFKLHSGAQ